MRLATGRSTSLSSSAKNVAAVPACSWKVRLCVNECMNLIVMAVPVHLKGEIGALPLSKVQL